MAVPERNRQVEAHRGFTASLDDSDVAEWMKMCEEWEKAEYPRKEVENPYHIKGTSK